MALPDCSLETPVCCDMWYRDGMAMATNIAGAMTGCVDWLCDMKYLVTMGAPLTTAGDFVSASLERISGITTAGATDSNRLGAAFLYRYDWEVRIAISGWPGIEGEGKSISIPSLEETASASRILMAVGERFFRSILLLAQQGSLVDRPSCQKYTIEDFRRAEPGRDLFAGQMGWLMKISYASSMDYVA